MLDKSTRIFVAGHHGLVGSAIWNNLKQRGYDNLIGRRSKGTEVEIPIETSDPSMDRRHCIINVKRNKQGEVIYTLRDNDSITGTFLMNEILGNKDRIRIEEGAIITLGATTLILRATEK